MRKKVQFLAVFWTLLIAVPLTALALSLAAYITEHLSEIMAGMLTFSQATTVGARGWLLELSGRWPEVAGMVVGQLVIMITLLLARRAKMAEEQNSL
jgi:hypothetical protein